MTILLHADPVPLQVDESGTIRVGSSRVTLDVLLADYRSGLSPEEIVRQLDTLDLADVYGAIAYYHRHRGEVEEYLRRREAEAEALRRDIEAGQPVRGELKAQLTARMAQRNGGHCPAEESAVVVPPLFRRSQEAFWRDLPLLLKGRRTRGKWVAYHGDEQIGVAPDSQSLLRECLRRGLRENDFYLDVIEPMQEPPWRHVEEIRDGLAEFQEGPSP
jgi:uncharacterized protein (DUF433 family)